MAKPFFKYRLKLLSRAERIARSIRLANSLCFTPIAQLVPQPSKPVRRKKK